MHHHQSKQAHVAARGGQVKSTRQRKMRHCLRGFITRPSDSFLFHTVPNRSPTTVPSKKGEGERGLKQRMRPQLEFDRTTISRKQNGNGTGVGP